MDGINGNFILDYKSISCNLVFIKGMDFNVEYNKDNYWIQIN